MHTTNWMIIKSINSTYNSFLVTWNLGCAIAECFVHGYTCLTSSTPLQGFNKIHTYNIYICTHSTSMASNLSKYKCLMQLMDEDIMLELETSAHTSQYGHTLQCRHIILYGHTQYQRSDTSHINSALTLILLTVLGYWNRHTLLYAKLYLTHLPTNLKMRKFVFRGLSVCRKSDFAFNS